MNYLYQLRGLLDDAGVPHLNLSGEAFAGKTIDETSLVDGSLIPCPFDWVGTLH